jgi:hypothetical protein
MRYCISLTEIVVSIFIMYHVAHFIAHISTSKLRRIPSLAYKLTAVRKFCPA